MAEQDTWHKHPLLAAAVGALAGGLLTGAGGFIAIQNNYITIGGATPTPTTTVTATSTVSSVATVTAEPSLVTAKPTADENPPPGTASTFLSEIDRVEGGGGFTGAVTILNKEYPKSTKIGCSTLDTGYVAWPTSGAQSLTALVGVADNEEDAADATATISFVDEDRQPLQPPIKVLVGSPKTVKVNLDGVTRLRVSCRVTLNQPSDYDRYFEVTLGDAALNP